ncbi:MAG: helix-turn-helix transcriptional regulator [Clostridia bacterium]|nr:helix-turn-helix transcriptional regulator [Clostridia bacterium]
MDQAKIGRFIAERRKTAGLTQMQLAEKLSITDRAVSKWETGRSLPDSSIMLELCKELNITVNDLLSGEVVTMENNNKETEKNLLALVREKENADKRLLNIEIVLGFITSIFFMTLIFVASFVEMQNWIRILLIVVGMVLFAVGIGYCLKIEQTAGYYECSECGNKYVPSFKSVLFAMHLNRTRYLKCPECGKRSWQKKVIRK